MHGLAPHQRSDRRRTQALWRHVEFRGLEQVERRPRLILPFAARAHRRLPGRREPAQKQCRLGPFRPQSLQRLDLPGVNAFPYKTAWFMCHRIRESLRDTAPSSLGGQGKVVEADESYVGGKAKNRKNHIPPKEAVFSLVERGGKVRSRHVADVSAKTLGQAIATQVDRATYIMTDEAPVYSKTGEKFAGHGTVNHSAEEYVRAYFWHTNTIEGYFSILKRGIIGTFHHVSSQHLHRYLAEFDFRYNEREKLGVSDAQRMAKSVQGIVGKRLTYRRTGEATNVQA
jgi:hypothetical protein